MVKYTNKNDSRVGLHLITVGEIYLLFLIMLCFSYFHKQL